MTKIVFKKKKAKDIKISNRNVRKLNVEEELEHLKKSINKLGLLNPIILDEKGEVIVGQRRLKALQQLGKDIVVVENIPKGTPLAIKLDNMENEEKVIASLVENIMRKDLTLEDIKETLQYLLKRYGSIERIAEVTGINVEWIKGWLKTEILPVPKTIREKQEVRNGLTSFLQLGSQKVEKREDIVEEKPRETPKIEEKTIPPKDIQTVKQVIVPIPLTLYNNLIKIAEKRKTTIQKIFLDALLMYLNVKIRGV